MKKILLILSVFAAFNVNAQFNNSSVITSNPNINIKGSYSETYTGPVERISQTNNKSRAINGWMSYQDANYVQGLQSAGLWPVYADSNLLSTGGTPPFHWYLHGLGTSFDPTSQKFYDGILGYSPPGNSQITQSDAFTIDSVEVVGVYRRRVSQTDQLRIEFTTTAGGALNLSYPADPYWFNNYGLTDSVHRFASPAYDWANNKMKSPTVTITKTLDLAAANDTNANGLNIYTMKLPQPLSVAPGEKVVAFLTFVPGTPFAHGTALDSANYWSHYCVESNGLDSYETPYTGESASGLIANTDARYNLTPNPINGDEYLSSTYAFVKEAGFDEPYFNFYVNCTSCNPISTNDVVKEFEAVEIYPNPATDNLNIELNEAASNVVNVTIYSMTGKKLMTDVVDAGNTQLNLDISNLPSGVYVCELESNGATHSAKVTKK